MAFNKIFRRYIISIIFNEIFQTSVGNEIFKIEKKSMMAEVNIFLNLLLSIKYSKSYVALNY